MSGFRCPHCNEVVDLLGLGGGEKTASNMGVEFLGKIPFDSKMVVCGDTGVSYQDTYADSTVTKAFEAVAEKMAKLAAV
jgi:ATP-binding protein involved in chromosome partitioning